MTKMEDKLARREFADTMREERVGCELSHVSACFGRMEVAHITPKRMGGGSTIDEPENFAWLCSAHHKLFDGLGQSRKHRREMRFIVNSKRSPALWRLLLNAYDREDPDWDRYANEEDE